MEEGSPQFYPGQDLSSPYIVEEDDGTVLNDSASMLKDGEAKSPKKKHKKKRADVPDIQANLYKSRNLRNAIRKEKKV